MKPNLYLLFVLAWICFCFDLSAVDLPKVFSDGMVLQRGMDTPIWGWGNPGDEVEVKFAEQTLDGKVDEDGKWMLRFKPLIASSESRKLTIQVGIDSVTLGDVVVGDVWMASGQSNMGWKMAQCALRTKDASLHPIADWVAEHKKSAKDSLLRRFAAPRSTSYAKELTRLGGKIDPKYTTWIAADSEDKINEFSGTAYFFGRELRREVGVPIGLLQTPWGGRKIQPFVPSTTYKEHPTLAQVYEDQLATMEKRIKTFDPKKAQAKFHKDKAQWEVDAAAAKVNNKKVPRRPKWPFPPKENANFPSTIYNAMVNPLVPYGIKGTIWYQGESNGADKSAAYTVYLEALITGWRERWGQGDFSFYFSQLATFHQPIPTPLRNHGMVTVNNNMRHTLHVKNTGMAVTNDIGDPTDIHPRNKVDVGKRLSLWALAKDYGKTDLVYSGPLYESHTLNDGIYTVTFSSAGSGLMVGRKKLLDPVKPVDERLGGFQISDANDNWKWAQAKIVGKNKIEAFHPDIPEPVELRYAWAMNPSNANLYNKEGLPASVFSTLEP
ncbi:MAG: 9-O-acetylesterase [Planctomycetes bacterium]|nr:9-O-acetylesterase [Planctomycetota bacterium]